MGQGDADRVVDLRGAGERRVETLVVERAHQVQPDLAGHLPVEIPPGEWPDASPPTWMVKGGAAWWKNCSAWSLEKMIHRSGFNARSPSPMRAATSRTAWITALSSVSGMVKNCGACGQHRAADDCALGHMSLPFFLWRRQPPPAMTWTSARRVDQPVSRRSSTAKTA